MAIITLGGETSETAVDIASMWGDMLRCAVPLGVVIAVVAFFAGSES
jgi:hypothetical protein